MDISVYNVSSDVFFSRIVKEIIILFGIVMVEVG